MIASLPRAARDRTGDRLVLHFARRVSRPAAQKT
jgi:hypothetical protein